MNRLAERVPFQTGQSPQWDSIDQDGRRLSCHPPRASHLPGDHQRVLKVHWIAGARSDHRRPVRDGFPVAVGDKVLIVNGEQMDKVIPRRLMRRGIDRPVRPVANLLAPSLVHVQPSLRVGSRQPGPPDEVSDGGRSMAAEVLPAQCGEGFIT